MDKKFSEAASFLSPEIKKRLFTASLEIQSDAKEICLRAQRPLVISGFSGNYFLNNCGGFSRIYSEQSYIVSKEELDECVRTLTEYSIHSYKREINAGFLTVRGGHRAGISGSAVCSDNCVLNVTDISSINLRIAREIRGAALKLAHSIFSDSVDSTLIAGAPASGKTTILKDLARILSNGELGYYKKLSLIDERGEIAAIYRGVPQNNVGILTDVFDGYHKGKGMEIAIRSMSPEVIMIDEIAGEQDAVSIRQSLNAGVAVIATVHASSFDELYRKQHIRSLISEGAFSHVVILQGADTPCKIAHIAVPDELVQI